MNPSERALLVQFLDQLSAASAGRKDSEADALIREAVSRQPDAAYLLVQRALQLEQALQIAQTEIDRLRKENERPNESGSFLGDPNAWGRSPAATTPTGASVAPIGASRAAAPPSGAAPQPSRWGSGLLGNVAATAAGVVAGSFLAQGVHNLLNRGADAPWGAASTIDAAPDDVALDDSTTDIGQDDDFDSAGWDSGGGDTDII